jgi:alkylated DNA repair dioxygenase AlkB
MIKNKKTVMEQLNLFGLAGKSVGIPETVLQYIPGLFSNSESELFMEKLKHSVPWEQRTVSMYGKQIITPRLTAWYGDDRKSYNYSGNHFQPMPWTEDLLAIRERIRPFADTRFNSVLLNYYRDGNDSVAWHSDNEKELGPQPVIGSVSFGAVRAFDIRKKNDHHTKFSVRLESGSLLIMKGDLQQNWEHRIAKSGTPMGARINLTFRVIQ